MTAAADFDFLAFCAPGAVLKTRDRRDARITAVDKTAGTIHGEVTMMGACAWLPDGRYRDAPGAAAGAWDLMPPPGASKSPDQSRHELLAEALRRGEVNPGCCD